MSTTFVDVCNYQPTERSTDPADIAAERLIAIRWLRGELDESEAKVENQQRTIAELYREYADA